MSGGKKRGGNGRRRGELAPFDIVDVNEIGYMPDEQLYRTLHELINVREDGLAVGADVVPVEIEICYVKREIQIRDARRNAHEQYVKGLQEENAVLEQAIVMSTGSEEN